MIQDIIDLTKSKSVLDMSTIFMNSKVKADNFIKKNPYVLVEKESSYKPKVNSDGTKKPKKGSKKILAIQVYNEHKNDGMSRKEFIQLLVDKVGLTPAGASTYFHNLQSNTWK